MLLAQLFRAVLKRGELTVIDANGRTRRYGDAARGPRLTIRLHDRALHTRLPRNPRLAIGEAYMDGTLTVEDGTIFDFLDLIGLNLGGGRINVWDKWFMRFEKLLRTFQQANPLHKAQTHVAHHYDLSGALYDLFLDDDRQYSCGYFPVAGMTLEEGQEAKKRHIASKLCLEPGQKVLDIGSGWGGFGLYLARTADVDVTGVTLSAEQHRVSQQRANESDVAGRVRFHLRDYREEAGVYDRIVSVGMFEHVGLPHYGEFFEKISDLLRDDGVALLHTIADRGVPVACNPWIRKYIFPGGYCPSLSVVLPFIERAGLWVTDIEILRLHYAETLHHWRERFMVNRHQVSELYDERFCRMWEFYLASCEMAFRHMGLMVAQIQLTKSVDAVPLTRDYMAQWEQMHAPAEKILPRRLRSTG
ncbi:MAG: cyclopropane-fatty-acyl-phospholipid synthase family protein [Alphaproteobacteria bacterium]|nr:cyclopropane-fatty-acyl-phospholipid synthase family protein [Alphaproteobacteria bacterium]